MVKKAVTSKWEEGLKAQARKLNTLKYINLNACSLTRPHPVWQLGAADILKRSELRIVPTLHQTV